MVGRGRAPAEFAGYEQLLTLPDKERGGADLLGWDARRVRRWMGRLGDPQLRFRCTLVAGSKGKGSTAAMLEAMLRAAGRRTGLYTQPHLHRYAERIRVAGRPLSPAASRAGLAAVLAAAPGPATAFEAATVFALWAFARAGVEEAVLEVGFGGRCDAVAEAEPAVVLLCPVEAEHADLLGPTLLDVAGHDVALCRYGRTCYAAPQVPAVRALFEDRLAAQGAVGGLVTAAAPAGAGGLVALRLPDGTDVRARLALAGPFQRVNAALAAAGAAALGLGPEAIAAGLAGARWPGRWERVRRAPEVIADAAHTPLSAAAVAEALAEARRGPGPEATDRRVALVVGLLGDKDAAGFARALRPTGARVFATAPDHPRAMPASRVAAAFRAAGFADVARVDGPGAALDRACAWAGRAGLCVVTGSVRMAAEARLHGRRAADRPGPASG